MNPCERLRALLGDLLEGELEADVRVELEQHLQDCPDCHVVVDATRRTVALYRGQQLYKELPVEVRERLMNKLRSHLKMELMD